MLLALLLTYWRFFVLDRNITPSQLGQAHLSYAYAPDQQTTEDSFQISNDVCSSETLTLPRPAYRIANRYLLTSPRPERVQHLIAPRASQQPKAPPCRGPA